MKDKIKYVLIGLVVLTINNFAQPTPNDVFTLLNLNYPGLRKVKEAVNSNNLQKAKKELLVYFQNRTNRKSEIDKGNFKANIPEAEMNAKNIFEIKTIKYDFGSNIDWTKVHKDKEWQFSLGRMNWFENYVAAYIETRDEKYVKAWMDQIESWIKLGNPGYPRTIDTGRRMENLTESYWMFVQVLKAKGVTPEFNALFLTSMYEQAEYLYKPEHWRRYSNWGTFENSGFSVFAVLFPEFKRDNEWLKELFFRMRTQLQNSYYTDGMHVETSPAYHSHELEVWFDFIKLVELNEIDDPWSPQVKYANYKELIVPKAIALMNMYKPTGYIPQVSDTDRRNERDLLYEIGKYFNVPELEYVASGGKEGTPPRYRSVVYPEGGYSILRSGWGKDKLKFKDELYLLFDFGNNKPWHAHYDIFNIVATAYDYDLLIDPGRYTYNDGEDRKAFKSTAYHNTVEVDYKDQMKNYKAPPIEYYFFDNFDYINGVQKSYTEVEHRRSIFFASKEYWIVVDRLDSESKHTYIQNWHLTHESLDNVEFDKNQVTAPHMLMLFPSGSSVKLTKGYQSRSYRKKIEIPVVENYVESVNNIILPVVIYPYDTTLPKIKMNETTSIEDSKSSEPITMEIVTEKYSDFYFERSNNENMFIDNEIETNSKVVFIRKNNSGEVTRILMIHGNNLKYKNIVLISIEGKNTNISVANGVVNLYGDCVTDFTINIPNAQKVYLNHKKIQVKIVNDKVDYHYKSSKH